jgi:hypothetical protein
LKCCWRGPARAGRRAWREPSHPLRAVSRFFRAVGQWCCFLRLFPP